MATLSLDAITKSFGKETVLHGLSLGVADQETIAIFGPSGSGKTVLLRLIAGVGEPDDGRLLVDGVDMEGVPPENRGIGMAFQNFALFPHMSARENIESPLGALGMAKEKAATAVAGIARLLKIEHVLGHSPRELSNGQKQRTALARALVAQPNILLLDDPLRNVDAKLRFEMRLELPRLLSAYGATVLYVTQDYKEAMALGDRIAVLIGGRFAQIDTPEEIYLRPSTEAVARLFGDPTINLLDVEPTAGDGGTAALIGGGRITLGSGYEAAHGKPCRLGIRPENLRFSAFPAPQTIPVTVGAVSPLNERVVRFLVTADGAELFASSAADESGPDMDAKAHLVLDPEHFLLFDASDGRRIERRPS